MKFREETAEACEIKMGPMIDCVFLLLLYFIAASDIKMTERYLGLMMPGSAPPPPKTIIADITLSITPSGQVAANQVPLDGPTDRNLPALVAKLKQAMALFGNNQPVVIHPQPSVKHQRIVDVLNACSAAGVKNLSFFANTQ